MALRAIEDRILVTPIDESKESEHGVILETRTEKPIKGSVVSVGPGRTLENGEKEIMDVKVGDLVYFTKYAPDEFYHNEEKYFSIKQSSILAINGKD